MAYRCDHCRKGVQYGHAVSHAKNRLRRLFKPNLQKLVVFLNGKMSIRVKLCTSCIKRLKKDKRLGNYYLTKLQKVIPTPKKVVEKTKPVKVKTQPTLDVASIVGSKK
jgi:large subunit ribosomal protein L28